MKRRKDGYQPVFSGRKMEYIRPENKKGKECGILKKKGEV